MKTLEDELAQYAAYHRDSRNIATHFVGIPLIVLAVTVLLSRPSHDIAGIPLSPALIAALAACAYYLRLDLRLGMLMTLLMGLSVWFGAWAARQPTGAWLAIGIGGFVVGWVFQFIGHAWEGRKPAFVDDLIGLIIGPLFVVAEALFTLGFMAALRERVEQRAGHVRRGAQLTPR
ncbi:MAG: Mpo1-like protein [Pseudomonadota bacterium]